MVRFLYLMIIYVPKSELLGSGTKNVIVWKYVRQKGFVSHIPLFSYMYTQLNTSLCQQKVMILRVTAKEGLYNEELTAARPMKVHQTLTWFEYCKRYQHLTCSWTVQSCRWMLCLLHKRAQKITYAVWGFIICERDIADMIHKKG